MLASWALLWFFSGLRVGILGVVELGYTVGLFGIGSRVGILVGSELGYTVVFCLDRVWVSWVVARLATRWDVWTCVTSGGCVGIFVHSGTCNTVEFLGLRDWWGSPVLGVLL